MKLAIWRKRKGMTQDALALELGCSQPYISQIERAADAIIPGPSIMIELYRLTDGAVRPDDFYDLPELNTARIAA